MHAFLLSLRMRMIREPIQTHMVKKWWIYIKPSLKGSTNTMISSALKPHAIAHTVCGRQTLNVFERFMKGSLRGRYEGSIYERTFLTEPIKNLKNHAISNAGRSQQTEGKIYTRNIRCFVACAMLKL